MQTPSTWPEEPARDPQDGAVDAPGAWERGVRLDRHLAGALPELSRSRIKALILAGHAKIDGATVTNPAFMVKPGRVAALDQPPPAPAAPAAQDIPLSIAHEDAHLVVVDKPAGLVTHPAPGHRDGTLVNALLHHCRGGLSGIGGVMRPGIVHRLDRDTSGLLVAAKSDAAHAGLAAQFAAHTVHRVYRAVARGVPAAPSGRVEGNIGRHPVLRQQMAVVGPDRGRPAVTHYRTLRRLGGRAALLACWLETGRTHQIRVHMTHIGHPLVGDPVYGARGAGRWRGRAASAPAVADFPRQALHAAELGFTHPVTGAEMRFQSPMPTDMRALVEALVSKRDKAGFGGI